jgi:hypothetical protein
MLLHQINNIWFGLYRQNANKNLPTFGFHKDVTKLISFLATGKYGDASRDEAINKELTAHNLPIYG